MHHFLVSTRYDCASLQFASCLLYSITVLLFPSKLRFHVAISQNPLSFLSLVRANKHVDYAIAAAGRGLTFKTGILSWNLEDPMIACVISDASHANESEDMLINGRTHREPHCSQGGRLICLGSESL